MTLLEDIKLSLRVTTSKLDPEVQMLIDAALYDMRRVGVNPTLLAVADGDLVSGNNFVKHALTAYCKAHFGYDNQEGNRFDDSYRRIVCDLLNSSQNVAAIEQAERSSRFYGLTPEEVWASMAYRPKKSEYRLALDWLGVEYTDDMTNAQLRALLAAACGVTEGE